MDILKDKDAKYLGTALVSIAHLTFPHPCRQIDRKVVEQLKRDFEGEGCLNEDISNGVPVMIDNEAFYKGLEKLAMNAGDFKAVPKTAPVRFQLDHGTRLECLHGQHRILAAKEFLSSVGSWWSADFYSTGRSDPQIRSMLMDTDLNTATKQTLREGYSYSTPFSSGEVFRQIRLCHFDKDEVGEQHWRGRLKPYQQKYLDIILKRKLLINALDSVLHIRGLWRTFYTGSLNEFIALGFDEVGVYSRDLENY